MKEYRDAARVRGTGGPSRVALLAFFGQLERITLERRHLHDQGALAIRPDPERRGMLPKEEPKAPPAVREAT